MHSDFASFLRNLLRKHKQEGEKAVERHMVTKVNGAEGWVTIIQLYTNIGNDSRIRVAFGSHPMSTQ